MKIERDPKKKEQLKALLTSYGSAVEVLPQMQEDYSIKLADGITNLDIYAYQIMELDYVELQLEDMHDAEWEDRLMVLDDLMSSLAAFEYLLDLQEDEFDETVVGTVEDLDELIREITQEAK